MMKAYDNFINIPFNKENVDLFIVRNSILKAIQETLPHFKGRLLDVGCGKMPYKEFILNNSGVNEYIGLDIETALVYDKKVQPDFTWDGVTMPFDGASFESAFGTEVLEHCPEPSIILAEIFRVLKPAGSFFFTVPFIWPLHEIPYDEFRYTPFSLERILKQAGFQKVEIRPLGGWNASLAQMLGLWVKRSPYPERRKKYLSTLFLPVIKYLLKTDFKPDKFIESTMVTGLYGIAYK